MRKSAVSFVLALAMCVACLTCCTETEGSNLLSDGVSADSDAAGIEEESSIPEITAEDSVMADSSEEADCASKDLGEPVTVLPDDLYYEPIDKFFNDSVFIGYSIMMHFGRYVNNWRDTLDYRIMGNAQFCTGVGMSFTANETQDPSDPKTTLPKYMGVAYHFEDLPKAMGVKTMYIGLTVYSELGRGTTSTCALEGAKYAIRGIQLIKSKNPDLNIVVLSGTYNTGESESGALNFERVNNGNIRDYNNYVLDYCNEAGVDFVDVSTPMTNGYGYFVKDWASDGSYHIKQVPYMIWIDVLRDYARKKQAGTWENIETMPELLAFSK